MLKIVGDLEQVWSPNNYCFHHQLQPPLLEITPIFLLHLVVIFHILCNLTHFYVFHDFSTDSVRPTHSHQLSFPWPGAISTSWDTSHISAPPLVVIFHIICFFMIFQLILFVPLTPTQYCFHDQVLYPLFEIPPILGLHLFCFFPLSYFCNFMIFQQILFILLTPTNYCFHDQELCPLLEISPMLVLHLVVTFHIFCNYMSCVSP